MQLDLLKYIKTLLPAGLKVVVVGDGEFDSSTLVSYLEEPENWHYVSPKGRRSALPNGKQRESIL